MCLHINDNSYPTEILTVDGESKRFIVNPYQPNADVRLFIVSTALLSEEGSLKIQLQNEQTSVHSTNLRQHDG